VVLAGTPLAHAISTAPRTIYFDWNSADLSADALSVLDREVIGPFRPEGLGRTLVSMVASSDALETDPPSLAARRADNTIRVLMRAGMPAHACTVTAWILTLSPGASGMQRQFARQVSMDLREA